MSFEEQIKKILLARIPDLMTDMIMPQAELIRDLGADSLALLEMLMDIEEQFDVSISDDEVIRILTVNDVYTCVREKMNEKIKG